MAAKEVVQARRARLRLDALQEFAGIGSRLVSVSMEITADMRTLSITFLGARRGRPMPLVARSPHLLLVEAEAEEAATPGHSSGQRTRPTPQEPSGS